MVYWLCRRVCAMIVGVVTVVAIFFHAVSPTSAAEEFTLRLRAHYTVSQTGLTSVEQTYTLTNNTPDRFATQYVLELSSTKLKNVTVTSNNAPLPTNVVTTDQKTSIGITFPDRVVGQGKSREFIVRYDDHDMSIVSGQILEAYVPKLANAVQFVQYDVTITTPAKFGKPTRVTPASYQTTTDGTLTHVTFHNPRDQGIALLYGSSQAFRYTLRYHLDNPTSSNGIMQIALPPDTKFQKLQYDSIVPLPERIEADADGNWIATYHVPAQKKVEVVAIGVATLYLEPQPQPLTPPPTADHTKVAQYWEFDQPALQSKAHELRTPRAIYDYTVRTLTYNFQKIDGQAPRLGAAAALQKPQDAACQEFTDVFIALARANGIPARRATGYAYTSNNQLRPLSTTQQVLHAWPEYYDETQHLWKPIDPTWGNTTGGVDYFDQFDVSHFVFTYNGTSSTDPFGAGAYTPEDKQKNVEVTFAPLPSATKLDYTAKWTRPTIQQAFTTFLQNPQTLTLINRTGTAFYQSPLTIDITSGLTQLVAPRYSSTVTLLPFQSTIVPVQFRTQSPILSQTINLTVSLGEVPSAHALTIGLIREPIVPIGLVICLVIGAGCAWGVLVSRRRRQRPVRR